MTATDLTTSAKSSTVSKTQPQQQQHPIVEVVGLTFHIKFADLIEEEEDEESVNETDDSGSTLGTAELMRLISGIFFF